MTSSPAGPATGHPDSRPETMRDTYRQSLLDIALHDPNVFCLDSDMGGLEESFASRLPDQYVNLGIAEANMMSVAAGLARAGKTVFVNTMAGFASARAAEQVKLDVAHNSLDVKIVASHAGVSAGHFGPSHWALEDIAIMRAFANMTVVVPADAAEAALAARAAGATAGPVYLRLGRKATPPVYAHLPAFEIGRAVRLRDGNDVTILAAGAHPVVMALQAHAVLQTRGIEARVANVHTIKPMDDEFVVDAAIETCGIVTVEEHSVYGGLGGAVCEAVTSASPCRVTRLGMPDRVLPRVGTQEELLEEGGISPARIAAAACSLLAQAR
ncbi:MAG: transketolase family protein [Actinomycetota bacterium]